MINVEVKVFVNYLAEFRKKRGLTQVALAETVNIGVNSIARYERGEIKPSIETANVIAHALGVTLEELLNGPATQEWELRMVVSKTGDKEGGTVDMTGTGSTATLSIGDNAMAITLSADYELWENDAKFEALMEDLRRKRQLGLKTRKEGWQ